MVWSLVSDFVHVLLGKRLNYYFAIGTHESCNATNDVTHISHFCSIYHGYFSHQTMFQFYLFFAY